MIWVQPLVKSLNCYRPQRSWGKVIFSEVCVKNSVHGGGVCLTACWDTSPGADTTQKQTPREQTPLWEQTLPWSRHPQRSACWEIRTTIGRYAFYWNAVLLVIIFGWIRQIVQVGPELWKNSIGTFGIIVKRSNGTYRRLTFSGCSIFSKCQIAFKLQISIYIKII